MTVVYGKICTVCKSKDGGMIMVKAIDSGSGPGWSLYACLTPCAQEYAERPFAGAWIKKELTELGLWPPKA